MRLRNWSAALRFRIRFPLLPFSLPSSLSLSLFRSYNVRPHCNPLVLHVQSERVPSARATSRIGLPTFCLLGRWISRCKRDTVERECTVLWGPAPLQDCCEETLFNFGEHARSVSSVSAVSHCGRSVWGVDPPWERNLLQPPVNNTTFVLIIEIIYMR